MAIKVNGTTVIDDSRNLQNVQGIKTINNTSILGSGNISAGASTTVGAVGTYGFLQYPSPQGPGYTLAASGTYPRWVNANGGTWTASYPSGTWQLHGRIDNAYGGTSSSLWLRIS